MIYRVMNVLFNRFRTLSNNDIDFYSVMHMVKQNECILIDVRNNQEYRENHLENSINIPVYELKSKIGKKVPNKNTGIIVYCQTGQRSKKAMQILYNMNYHNIYNLKGGLDNL